METLQSVFPTVPVPALERVLDICDQNVETASEWILENNWRELVDDEDNAEDAAGDEREGGEREQDGAHQQPAAPVVALPPQPAPLQRVHVASRSSVMATAPVAAASAGAGTTDTPLPTMIVSTQSNLAAGGSLAIGGSSGNATVGGSNNNNSNNGMQFHRGHHHHHHHHHAVSSGNGRALGRDDRDFDSGGEQDIDSDEGDYEEDEDEDDEDDDDDDDDDEDGHSYYDSGDDAFFHGAMPPLAKRIKITREEETETQAKEPKQDMYWVAFDGQVVRKNLIELLNTTLSKLAHSKVTLLNKLTKHVDEPEAKQKLKSVLTVIEESETNAQENTENTRVGSSRNGLSHLLNDADAKPPATHEARGSPAGQKRKRTEEAAASSPPKPQGFFAHFFPVSDLDMIWRSVMHAHLFNSRFGEMIEFHTASCGTFNKRDFDELMHIHSNMASSRAASLGLSPLATLKCCLILPCDAAEEEIFRVGKHLHSLLKLQGSLYYRTLDDPVPAADASSRSPLQRTSRSDLLNEDGKMTEDSFRRFARYRIKKEEPEAVEPSDSHALGPDHFLAYQQQRKVEYCLQSLKTDGWDRRLTS